MNNKNASPYILEAKNITKKYPSGSGELEVVKGIDVKIRPGEILVIMGPSGAGKSTLLHIMGTLDLPSSGELTIESQNIASLSEADLAKFRNLRIGFVFQFHYLLPEFSALENLLIPKMMNTPKWKNEKQPAIDLLNEVGLGERLNHRPSQLSGGEQQRVAMARALINNPGVVFADEPTGNLDSRNSQALFDLILSLNKKYQQTFVIVTHDEMFAKHAHRVIHLLDGKIDHEEMISQ